MSALTQERPAVVEYNTKDEYDGTPLKITDRCDHCGAQAHNIAVSETTGNRLLFCNHYTDKHGNDLVNQGFRVERHRYSFGSGIKEIPPAEKRR